MNFKIFTILLLIGIVAVNAATPTEWENRSIYQVLTDRFAQSPNVENDGGCDLSNYCGGTFQGLISKLDYIQSMGFDAIWISPIPVNTQGGYHGYWQKDFTKVNPHFGSAQDLKALSNAMHQRGMFLMLDVVGNHVGPVGFDFSQITPFNESIHYHADCAINDWNNQTQVEICRLASLPDLNQTVDYVRQGLLDWVKNTVEEYKIDGLRIDTVPEVAKDFWKEYTAASGVYTVGEVFNGNINYVSSYQGAVDGTLSYPLFFTIKSVFEGQQSMYNLQNLYQQYDSSFENVHLLGTFADNHDNPRFLNSQSDYTLYRNALTLVLTSSGIPIVYYGTEQYFHGGNDPQNREPMWPSGYKWTNMCQFLKQLNQLRSQQQLGGKKQVQRYADDNFYAYTRDQVFVALTNVGSNGSPVIRTIRYHPYSNGQVLCSFFDSSNCMTVTNSQFTVTLNKGEPNVWLPKQ